MGKIEVSALEGESIDELFFRVTKCWVGYEKFLELNNRCADTQPLEADARLNVPLINENEDEVDVPRIFE